MFLRTETARSDFFLVSAIILFGSLLSSLIAGFIPGDTLGFWVGWALQPLLLIIAPIWLQKARQQPLADLYRGSVKDAVFGVVIALPVLLGVVAIQMTSGGIGLYFNTGLLFPALLKWVAVGFSMAFMVQRADIAFPGEPVPASYLSLRMAGVLIGIGAIVGLAFATLAGVTSGSLAAVTNPLGVALLPIGAGLAWALAERLIGLAGNINRNAWITVAVIYFLAEINIFGFISDFRGFAFDFMMLAPLGALILVTLAAWEMRKSVWFGYGVALVYALSSVPGKTGII